MVAVIVLSRYTTRHAVGNLKSHVLIHLLVGVCHITVHDDEEGSSVIQVFCTCVWSL